MTREPLFDPVTGKLRDVQALRSITVRSVTFRKDRVIRTDRAADLKVRERIDQDTGRVAAHTTEHGDGRVDQQVFAEAAKAGTAAN